ncbi:NAD-dependent glyceraldehyde-3-phosphate dehydrogenase [hydrothermal vent metagenome]|uniref:NAD-dependent glyceraldehyde-3-phosphate dehydrogenase n=1 Tax=hydrothermal vent metagenome TaxID=652676 RepID=A0A3B0V095_9ZZZZ
MALRIAINGFGRIGRQLTRLLTQFPAENVKLAAVNTLETTATAAHLLKYDSCQGIFPAEISSHNDILQVDHHKISFFHEPDPALLPWQDENIDLIIECSGHFTDAERAAAHLAAGAKRVLITAAASNVDAIICLGVNENSYRPEEHKIISSSSCTTNCIAPALSAINRLWGVEQALATFIHSSTSAQHLLDHFDPDPRRARAAGLNLIPCPTSASHQIPAVIPTLRGRFDALAIRVPTPHIHLADLTICLRHTPDRADFTAALAEEAASTLQGIMRISNEPLVSIDLKGSKHSCVIDAEHVHFQDNMVKLLIWHANEFAYCCRIKDIIELIARQQY